MSGVFGGALERQIERLGGAAAAGFIHGRNLELFSQDLEGRREDNLTGFIVMTGEVK